MDVPFLMPEMPVENFERRTFPKGVHGWVATKREDSGTRALLRMQKFPGLLLTHGCTIDNGGSRITFALIEPAGKIEEHNQKSLRDQEMASLVFLPGVPGLGDCYADLRVTVTLPNEFLKNERRAKMTPEAKLLLEAKLVHFYTRINEGWLVEHLAKADRTPT